MKDYSRICEVLDFESDEANFTVSFKILTKKYGREFKAYAQAAWLANDGILTEDQFMKMNAGIPKGYFDKVVKNPDKDMLESLRDKTLVTTSTDTVEIAEAFGFV